MRFTRRYWAIASLVLLLSVGAVVLVQPVLMFGAAVIGGWLLARQYLFIEDLRSTIDDLEVGQSLEDDRVVSGEAIGFELTASLSQPSSIDLWVHGGVPLTASEAEESTVRIRPDGIEAIETRPLKWEVAGTFSLDQAMVLAADPYGYFVEEFSMGTTPTITVEPGNTRSINIDRLSKQIRQALGNHEADPLDLGLEPTEIRQYFPGDTVRRIDWKATARLNTTHVRTFETETDRRTLLVIDRRETMGQGRAGRTKLDYARHVGLLILKEVRFHNDPLGCYVVDRNGTDLCREPTNTNRGYAAIGAYLYDLVSNSTTNIKKGGQMRSMKRHRTAARLTGDESTFATTIISYFDKERGRPQNPEEKPLLGTIKTNVQKQRGATSTVIITDDTNHQEVREAVMAAREGKKNRVFIVLAPTVLFEQHGLQNLAAAHERYREFEAFIRSLEVIDRVETFELAPDNRLTDLMVNRRVTTGAHD